MTSPSRPIPRALGHIPPEQLYLWGERLGNTNTLTGGTPPSQPAEEGVLSERGGELAYESTHQYDLPAQDQSTPGTTSPSTGQPNVADERNPAPGQYVGAATNNPHVPSTSAPQYPPQAMPSPPNLSMGESISPGQYVGATNNPHAPSTSPPQYPPQAMPSPANLSMGESNFAYQWVQHDPVHFSSPNNGSPYTASNSSSPLQYDPIYADNTHLLYTQGHASTFALGTQVIEHLNTNAVGGQPDAAESGPAGPMIYVSQPDVPTHQNLRLEVHETPASLGHEDRFAFRDSEFGGDQVNAWDAQDPGMIR